GHDLMTVTFTNVNDVQRKVTASRLARFREGLRALTFDRSLDGALAARSLPLIGTALGDIITQISKPEEPLSDPVAGVEFGTTPQVSTSSPGDSAPLFTRLLQGGTSDFLVSRIENGVDDLDALRQALDDLDGTSGNVTYETVNGVTRFYLTVARTFGGTAT